MNSPRADALRQIPFGFDTPSPEGQDSLQSTSRKARKPPRGVATKHAGRLLRRREVQHITGLSRSSLYRLIAAGEFPKAIQLSTKSVAWLEVEVDEWVGARVTASRSGPGEQRPGR